MARLGSLIVVAVLLGLVGTACGPEPTVASVPLSTIDRLAQAPPVELPDFAVTMYQGGASVGGSQVGFHDLLRGRPVVVNYWASNCPPCALEMPEFERVWRRYQGRVLFLGIDAGRFFGFGDAAQSRRELQTLGISYPAGTPDTAQAVLDLRLLGLPTTHFITADGRLLRSWTGILNEAKLTELVETTLAAG